MSNKAIEIHNNERYIVGRWGSHDNDPNPIGDDPGYLIKVVLPFGVYDVLLEPDEAIQIAQHITRTHTA